MTDSLPTDATAWPKPDTVSCPHCQTLLTYYDPNSSVYGCTNCQSLFKAEYDDPPQLIRTRNFEPLTAPVLALGTEGYLRGEWVRVTGYMHKQERNTSYKWREYMLLLKDGTTRQLAEYNGHWMWIGPASEHYVLSKHNGVNYVLNQAGDDFKLYARYYADLLTAIGEFDWNVVDDEALQISEYIRPPRMLVNERHKPQSDWYEAEYVTTKELETAFSLPHNTAPIPYGTGAIQPNKDAEQWKTIWPLSWLAILAVIVIHIVNIGFRPSGRVHQESLTVSAQYPSPDSMAASGPYQRAIDSARIAQVQPTPPRVRTKSFTIDGPTAVEIEFTASVDNTWVEFATELVDEKTNQRYIFTEAVEYYHGYESGESWTEGGTEHSATLSRIPAGRYHLEILPYTQYGQSLPFIVTVSQNTSLISNVFLLIGLLLLCPAYLLFSRSSFETNRWNQSDYGPKTDE